MEMKFTKKFSDEVRIAWTKVQNYFWTTDYMANFCIYYVGLVLLVVRLRCELMEHNINIRG